MIESRFIETNLTFSLRRIIPIAEPASWTLLQKARAPLMFDVGLASVFIVPKLMSTTCTFSPLPPLDGLIVVTIDDRTYAQATYEYYHEPDDHPG